GIGHAVAVKAGGLGWSVAINYREDSNAAETTLRKVRSAGGRGIIVQGDVSVEADVMRMFATTAEAFSAIDGVVVNAGIVAPASKLADMSVDRIRRTLDVNVLGGYLCAREAARYL